MGIYSGRRISYWNILYLVKRFYALFIFVFTGLLNLLPISILFAQEIPQGYEKFETEELGFFRKKIAFKDPFPNQIINIDTTLFIRPAATPGSDTAITVELRYPEEIEVLLAKHQNLNSASKDRLVKGFRIQIYAGLERNTSDEVKMNFLQQFPDTRIYQSYSRPTFKIRVGDFMTRQEAELFCQRVKNWFPGAFVVSELIELTKQFNPYEKNGEGK